MSKFVWLITGIGFCECCGSKADVPRTWRKRLVDWNVRILCCACLWGAILREVWPEGWKEEA